MCYGWVRRLPTSRWMSAGTVQCVHDRTNLLHTAKCWWVYSKNYTLQSGNCTLHKSLSAAWIHTLWRHEAWSQLIVCGAERSRLQQRRWSWWEMQGRLADRGQMWIWAVFWSPNLRKASKRKNLRPTQINSQSHSSQRSNLPLVG